ncbi:MAG TPA: PEP-CTERM sorting domain-containing protein [Kiritimatiellia bacterium]|nr:PEP-CTERM sorting domain-containing protein [Kiritimatiellia bacterium]
MKKIIAIAAVVLLGSHAAKADLLVGWDFAGLAGITTGSVTSNVADADMADTSTMLISRGSGLTPASNTGGYAANNWSTTFDTTDYYEFNAIADDGYIFDVTNITLNIRRSGTGPSNFVIRSSADNFTSDLDAFVAVANGAYASPITLSAQTNVTFRLYGYDASGAAGSMNLGGTGNDLVIQGTISVVPEPGTLAILSLGFLSLYGIRRRRQH